MRPLVDVQVERDGPLGVVVPTTTVEFTRLGLPVPDFLWLCQEASGSLAPAIGNAGVTLAPVASPLYQQTVTGWARKFVGTLGGTASQRFETTSALLDLAAGESYAFVVYVAAQNSAGQRIMGVQGQNNANRFADGNTSSYRTAHNAIGTETATGNYNNLAVVHPLIWYRNGTTNQSGMVTDLDQVIATHDESAATGLIRSLGAASDGNFVAHTRFSWAAAYKGTNAERDWKSYLQTLGWSLSY